MSDFFDALFSKGANIAKSNASASVSSVYRKELFTNDISKKDLTKHRRQLRSQLENHAENFRKALGWKNVAILQEVLQDFSKFYRETYAVNDYTLQSISRNPSEKTEQWREVFTLFLEALKNFDNQKVIQNDTAKTARNK